MMSDGVLPQKLRVTSLEQLAALAKEGRAVCTVTRVGYADGTVTESVSRPLPAAWVINHSGARLLYLFESGLYLHVKKGKVTSDGDGAKAVDEAEKEAE